MPTLGAWTIFRVFLGLGLTSFGGPVAHIGYYRDALVVRRQWLDAASYADLVALCQFLPGPASTQVGMGIGLLRGGLVGGLAAWAGFMLPSAVLMIGFGAGFATFNEIADVRWLHGLKLAAVAVVAHAVWTMGTQLCTDRLRVTFALATAIVMLVTSVAWLGVAVIAAAALAGRILLADTVEASGGEATMTLPNRKVAVASLAAFFVLLAGLPIAATLTGDGTIAIIDAFWRAGSLVFGGGHVVLPLLQAEMVPTGWVDADAFLAGYGAAQAVPGPMFTFAGYLGAVIDPATGGSIGNTVIMGIVAMVAVFGPAYLLIVGTLPFWSVLRTRRDARAMLAGVNAAVVGLLLAALYDPVWTSTVRGPVDVALALAALQALAFWRLPAWAVVIGCAVAGAGVAAL